MECRGGNALTGQLPDTFGQCPQLGELSFDINNLSGNLPPSLCSIPAGETGQVSLVSRCGLPCLVWRLQRAGHLVANRTLTD